MNNISFQGRTDFFISSGTYQRVAESARRASRNLSKTRNCKLSNNQIYTLKTDPENITVIMKNEKDSFFKYVPISEKAQQNALDEISINSEILQNTAKNENVTAWIVGGTEIYGRHGHKVVQTLNKIAKLICDKTNIDTSILVGSKTGEEILVLKPTANKLKVALDKKFNPEHQVTSELENMFDIVELNNTNLSYLN